VSLRLAEALIRTAVPEGHEPLRDLAELRAHMDGTHQLGVAGMLPLHVLMHMHEEEHAEPQWHGSPDSSRSTEFTARRKTMAGRWMGEDEHMEGIAEGVRSMKARGLLPRSHPENDQPGVTYDTGHHVETLLGGEDGQWTSYVTHEDDRPGLPRVLQVEHGDLGGDHSRLGDSVHAMLRHPGVMASMREMMQHRGEPEPSWYRKFEVS